MTYYKATRPDGTDFRTGTIDYAAALASGGLVRHPAPEPGCEDASGYLSVSTVATDCTGMSLPCRLFRVDPDGETWRPNRFDLPNKVACTSLRVVEELPATLALGPQGEQIVALIERCAHLTATDVERLAAARAAARDAAWDAARAAARLVLRDLIGQHGFTQEHYDLLTEVWRKAIGPIHPADAPISVEAAAVTK